MGRFKMALNEQKWQDTCKASASLNDVIHFQWMVPPFVERRTCASLLALNTHSRLGLGNWHPYSKLCLKFLNELKQEKKSWEEERTHTIIWSSISQQKSFVRLNPYLPNKQYKKGSSSLDLDDC